jgi:23S rRNA pseudouridine2605 synthase
MRLQKYLAQAGIASRRASEQIIREGHVCVNNQLIEDPAHAVDETKDQVTVDGKVAALPSETKTLLIYKPRGYICSASSAQGKSVLELVDVPNTRLFPVGRLDKDSEGLLLLTNDGELTNTLTHPRYQQQKRYEVTVTGLVSPAVIQALNQPMLIDDYQIQPATVTIGKERQNSGKTLLIFELREGRNRQIRKMCETVGLRIHRLVRTQLKFLTLIGLQPGQWRELSDEELRKLKTE